MDGVVFIIRAALAAVFVVAALGKALDRAGSRRAVLAFGVPETLGTPVAVALPVAELVAAGLLLVDATAQAGSVVALALLVAFIAGIAANLARGRQPDCHCFGQLHSSPIGWRTLVRNVVLAALGAFVLAAGPGRAGEAGGWIGGLSAGVIVAIAAAIVLALALAAMAVMMLNLLRQNGRLLVRIEALESRMGVQSDGVPAAGLPIGSSAPAFSLPGLHGDTQTLDSILAADRPAMLVFSDPDCGPCSALLPEIGTWQREHASQLTIALVSRKDADANRAKVTEHGVTNVLLDDEKDTVHGAYQSLATPSAVVVTPPGTIASSVAAGADAIRTLLNQALTGTLPPPAPAPLPAMNGGGNGSVAVHEVAGAKRVGEPAPEVKLPNLAGKTVRLEDFKGHRTVVLFWNPGCGFCQRMLPDLKEWERKRPVDAPRIVLVSSGTTEANRDLGLRSPVLLDGSGEVMQSFEANGTPMAVLVDEEGRIASPVAVGADQVLELCKRRDAEKAEA